MTCDIHQSALGRSIRRYCDGYAALLSLCFDSGDGNISGYSFSLLYVNLVVFLIIGVPNDNRFFFFTFLHFPSFFILLVAIAGIEHVHRSIANHVCIFSLYTSILHTNHLL